MNNKIKWGLMGVAMLSLVGSVQIQALSIDFNKIASKAVSLESKITYANYITTRDFITFEMGISPPPILSSEGKIMKLPTQWQLPTTCGLVDVHVVVAPFKLRPGQQLTNGGLVPESAIDTSREQVFKNVMSFQYGGVSLDPDPTKQYQLQFINGYKLTRSLPMIKVRKSDYDGIAYQYYFEFKNMDRLPVSKSAITFDGQKTFLRNFSDLIKTKDGVMYQLETPYYWGAMAGQTVATRAVMPPNLKIAIESNRFDIGQFPLRYTGWAFRIEKGKLEATLPVWTK